MATPWLRLSNTISQLATYCSCLHLTAGLRALGTIATAETLKPSRKLLLWVGPGLTSSLFFRGGTGQYPNGIFDHIDPRARDARTLIADRTNPRDREDIFEKIYWFSTLLRHAHISIDTFSVGEDNEPPALAQIPLSKRPQRKCLPTGYSTRMSGSSSWLTPPPPSRQA
jgi:hypothetical protein